MTSANKSRGPGLKQIASLSNMHVWTQPGRHTVDYKGDNFQTSCLSSCILCPFEKGILSKWKECGRFYKWSALKRTKYFKRKELDPNLLFIYRSQYPSQTDKPTRTHTRTHTYNTGSNSVHFFVLLRASGCRVIPFHPVWLPRSCVCSLLSSFVIPWFGKAVHPLHQNK